MIFNISPAVLVGPIGRVIPLIALALLFIGNYTKSISLLIGTTLLFFIVALAKFLKTKVLLKEAIDYCQVVHSGPTVILELILLILFLAFYLLWLPEKFQLNDVSTGFFIGISITMTIGNYYHKFANSISCYETGIRLPNKLHQTIYWSEIQDIRHEQNYVTIELYNGFIKTWEINASDFKAYKTITAKFAEHSALTRPI